MRPDGNHDQAELTDQDGNTFRVHLLAIHRVTVASSVSNGTSKGKSGNSNRSPAFTGKAGNTQGSANAGTAPGDAPPGEPSQPFTYQGFFGDSSSSSTPK
jgi:hypothetical protein